MAGYDARPMNNPDSRTVLDPADPPTLRRPSDLLTVRVFLVTLAVLLAGYMFLGRGFARLGMRPLYIGEVVLILGLVATAYAVARLRLRPAPSRITWLLLAFMLLGVARTVPYLGSYGVDALRDAVLWGYGIFALMIYVLADRALILTSLRTYGAVVPAFALWVPIYLYLFVEVVGPVALGHPEAVPILYFKNQDIAVHALGAIAFLVIGTSALTNVSQFLWRTMITVPLAWTVYTTGSLSRGALAAVLAGLGVLFLLAPRSRKWGPVLAGTLVFVLILVTPGALSGILQPGEPQPTPTVSATPSSSSSGEPTSSPGSSNQPTTKPTPTPMPIPESTPEPTPPEVRSVSPIQWIENVASVFSQSSDENLEGTKQFRLAWWTKIVGYTVFGPHFWTGKGFGVNLADDDGFQVLEDGSLRAPHNSHITSLARMGVPGFVLWVLLQGAFAIGLLRSIFAHRRSGNATVAAVGAWILVYWTAMVVNTSFDPYLEGPQGGIWFWTLFGLGMVVMRISPPPSET